MKKRISFAIIAATAMMMTAACSKDLGSTAGESVEGSIEFNIECPVAAQETRSYTEAKDGEKKVNKLQVLVFDSQGVLNAYISQTSLTGSITTTLGAKKIWAVVNGPDLNKVLTESELKTTALTLGSNAADSFVMTGSAEHTVTAGNSSCNITVSRLVSRISLDSVTNNMPEALGELKIQGVYLSNVVGNQNMAGSAAATTWYNQEGRKDESPLVKEHIIDGKTYMASVPALTYNGSALNIAHGVTNQTQGSWLFYTYPNTNLSGIKGFNSAFQAQSTALVVIATVNGKTQYYPVVLNKEAMARNKSYSVDLTVTGLGSDDPNTKIEKGSATFSVTVEEWGNGASYTETL